MKKILSLCVAALLLFGGCSGGVQSPPSGYDDQPSLLDTESSDSEPTVSELLIPTSSAYDPSAYTPSVNEGVLLVEVIPNVVPMHKVSVMLFVSITNLSEGEYRSNFMYTIEQFDGEDWLEIPHSAALLSVYPLVSLKKGESFETKKQLDARVVFTPGNYRIKVDDWYGEFEIIPSDPNMLAVEFDANPISLEDFTDSGILITIRNLSDETYEGGMGVGLEHFDGSEWVDVPWDGEYYVSAVLINVSPGETRDVAHLKAEMFDFDFVTGRYRAKYDQWYGEFEIT